VTATPQDKFRRRRLSRYISCVALILLFYGLAAEFTPEIMALAWHARYGRNLKLGSYQIPSSALWLGFQDEGGWSVTFFQVHGRFRQLFLGQRAFGVVSFSIAPQSVTGAERRAVQAKIDEKMGRATVFLEATVTGSPYVCFENQQGGFQNLSNCTARLKMKSKA
jgi:hypothetical protein